MSRSATHLTVLGCFNFPAGSTLMTYSPALDPTNLTAEQCMAACSAYLYFGLTGGDTCYCGNTPASIGVPAVSNSFCYAMSCTGNQFEMCGDLT
jgi:hypothetical protein